jgi:hypothetical protein
MTKKKEYIPTRWFDPDFVYVDAEHTDITKTWRKFGWTPPTEYRTDYNFGGQERGV